MKNLQQFHAAYYREKKALGNSNFTNNNLPQKTAIEFIDNLLEALQSKRKGFKEFTFFLAHHQKLQQNLREKSSDKKETFMQQLLQIGQEYGYNFTVEDVEKRSDSWWICSVEDLLSKVVEWSRGGIQQFLTDIKNEKNLQKELHESTDLSKFVSLLKNLLAQPERKKKYPETTEQDIEAAAKLIPTVGERIIGRIWA